MLVIGKSRELRKTITDWLDFVIKKSCVFVVEIMSNCMIIRGFYSQFVRLIEYRKVREGILTVSEAQLCSIRLVSVAEIKNNKIIIM